nr:hypothetical protein CFP56_67608 [Quercus suber]
MTVLLTAKLLRGRSSIYGYGSTELLQLGFLGKLDQEGQSLVGEEVLREVEQRLGAVGFVLEDAAVLLKALGIFFKLGFEHHAPSKLVVVLHQGLP